MSYDNSLIYEKNPHSTSKINAKTNSVGPTILEIKVRVEEKKNMKNELGCRVYSKKCRAKSFLFQQHDGIH